MEGADRKEVFKYLIKEFHTLTLPLVVEREQNVPLFPKKVVTIYGARRVGKSFYLLGLINKLLKKKIPLQRSLYINFEDDRIFPMSFRELDALLEAYFELYPENKEEEKFFFLDEIQNIEKWEIFVRRIYDKEKVFVFITGSSSRLLSREIATSLRGRTLSFPLFPLNFREFLRFRGIEAGRDLEYTSQRFTVKKLLEEHLEFGGFPEVVLEKSVFLKRKILEEYFRSLFYRDLAERFSLHNLRLLDALLKYLFTNATNLFSVNSYYKGIRETLSVSRETVGDYLSYIEETGAVSCLEKFSYSLKEQKVNPKKIIVVDNGLRNVVSFRFSPDTGRLAENLVGRKLVEQTSLTEGSEVYYWKNKGEVDFVQRTPTGFQAVNVSYGETIGERETGSLSGLREKLQGRGRYAIITRDLEKEENGVRFTPLWKWLLA